MAQGDIFSNFLRSGGILDQALANGVITANKYNNILEDIMTKEMNLAEVKRNMLRSDQKGFNVLKKLEKVGTKIYTQQKDSKKLKQTIRDTDEDLLKLEKDIIKARKSGNTQLETFLDGQKKQKLLASQINRVNLTQMRRSVPMLGSMGKAGEMISDVMVSVGDALGSIIPIVGSIISGLVKLGSIVFKMVMAPLRKVFDTFLRIQSVVGNLAADIGLTNTESKSLLYTMASLGIEATKFGGTIEDVAKVIDSFSAGTNKNRIFNQNEIGQLVELGLGTGLGVDAASDLAASFDNIGVSLEKTIKLTDKARGLAAKYGINTSKVLQNYKGLVDSLTGIGFGKGLENLTKLAAKAAAIRFDIVKSTQAFSGSFSDIENSVEAAAKMQVLGGKFAQSFGDPIQLAFESVTDPAALADKFSSLVTAMKDSKGDYFISPAERKMLKIAAETLGQSYEEAYNAAIEQAKMADKLSMIAKRGFSLIDFSNEEKMQLASLSQMKDGEIFIKNSAGVDTLLQNLTGKDDLKKILSERDKNDKAAIGRKNLMERLGLIVDRVMMGFSNVFNKLFGGSNFESFLQQVETVGTQVGQFVAKDLLGDGGLADGFNKIIETGRNMVDKISQVFSGDGPFLTKVAKGIGILFEGLKPMLKDLFAEIISYVTPFLKVGFGTILKTLGEIVPKWLGGKSMFDKGLQMEQEGLNGQSKGSKFLSDMYGSPDAQYDNKGNDGTDDAINKLVGRFGKKGLNMVGSGAKLATKAGTKTGLLLAKRIPVLGSLISAGFAINDLLEGDWAGAGLQTASAIANLFPGIGSAISTGIDAVDIGREVYGGTMQDGILTPDGKLITTTKGDFVAAFHKSNPGDLPLKMMEMMMPKGGLSGGSASALAEFHSSGIGSTNAVTKLAELIEHGSSHSGSGGGDGMKHTIDVSGVIKIESPDGKVVTWDQMYAARDLIGAHMNSISDTYNSGFGNYANPNKLAIKPIF